MGLNMITSFAFILLSLTKTRVMAEIFPRQTGIGPSSIMFTSTTITPSPAPTTPAAQTCCEIWQQRVFLNDWYRSSYNHTIATILTQYIQYDDTLITTTTIMRGADNTVYGQYAPYVGFSLPGVPNNLLPNLPRNQYAFSSVLSGTTVGTGDHVFTSPAAFANYSGAWVVRGVPTTNVTDQVVHCAITKAVSYQFLDSTGGVSTVTGARLLDAYHILEMFPTWSSALTDLTSITFPTPYYSVGAGPTSLWTQADHVTLGTPQSLVDWMLQDSAIVAQYPDLTKCKPGSGAGAPTINIPVKQLTFSTTSLITVAGRYTAQSVLVPTATMSSQR
ncbi:hypothetical protein LTR16_003293 [Cryomyces antarcticus]|uniref:Uncharacterized protein n=1 Tax=Cryomyces antarcticus TaxID=329879 RepID=A0ABR0LZM2_9PEZI|nr:hypothetical protein LTR39_002531 [Cryomyces antarcticus]KAK5016267.1 hypothetical protein LTR60_002484 [Cryomyces antarcticus]KAK5256423.1 hypothetical protein LTR16_003293 [Cryomyces antarcticus]